MTLLFLLVLDQLFFNGKKLYNSRFLYWFEQQKLLKPIYYFSILHLIYKWLGIKPKPRGFCIGAKRQMNLKDSFRHLLVSASTGSGKSQKLAIPTVLNSRCSMVITDPKGELFSSTASYLYEKKGFDIQVLDLRPEALFSHSYNPLFCKTLSELKNKCDCFYDAVNLNALKGSDSSNFWKSNAVNLLFVLAQILLKQSEKFRNMVNLRHLLQIFSIRPKEIKHMALQTTNKQLIQELEVILKYDTKILKNSITVAATLLDLFSDERIAKLTAQTTLKIEQLRSKLTAIYVIVPAVNTQFYSPITALLYMDVFALAQQPKISGQPFHPLLLILDEAANTSVIQKGKFANLLATVRSNECGCMVILQSHSQLANQVGIHEMEEIKANTVSEVLLAGVDDKMAQDYSKKFGTTTAQFTAVDNENIREASRPLIAPEEIQQMPDNTGIFIHANFRPALIKMQSAFQNRVLRKRMKLQSHIPLPKILDSVEIVKTDISFPSKN